MDKQVVKNILIIIAVPMVILGVFAGLVALAEAGREDVATKRQIQLEQIKQTCSDRGGVRSFVLEQGYVCEDGSVHSLPMIGPVSR